MDFSIQIVSRPKLVGEGEYLGVLLPDGRVIANDVQSWVRLITYADFTRGYPLTVIRVVPVSSWPTLRDRLRQVLMTCRAYPLTKRNCEKLASWLTFPKRKRSPFDGWAIAAFAVAAAAIVTATAR
jgi:hypothetical protein